MDSHRNHSNSKYLSESAGSQRVQASWTLVRGVGTAHEQTVTIGMEPFIVGRRPGASLQLNYQTISGAHAEISVDNSELFVRDLGSTNGTYVNGVRIVDRIRLKEADLVQFADIAFRVKCEKRSLTSATMHEDMCDNALALVQFDRLMESRLVTPFFQPIIDLQTDEVLGYEILARSRLFGLESCAAMFEAAARLNMEVELSRMLRYEGIREGLHLPGNLKLFVNTHPMEIRDQGLVDSLATIRQNYASIPIVLEIHEAAIMAPRAMRLLRSQLRDLNIGLAYDDFGAGQTRLSELTEAPPDFLKFDISLISNIDKTSPERLRMLASLVKVALDLGVNPLAEGVESCGEADTCRRLGFLSAQGYHFGRPSPLKQYL